MTRRIAGISMVGIRLAALLLLLAGCGDSGSMGSQMQPIPTAQALHTATRTAPAAATPVRSHTPSGSATPSPTATFPGSPLPTGLLVPTPTGMHCSPTPTPWWPATEPSPVILGIGSAVAPPGGRAEISVTLLSGATAGVQNDITFPPQISVVLTAGGTPDCTVNPLIDKEATAFALLDDGSGEQLRLRALVLSVTQVDEIEPGSLLYTCAVDIAADAASVAYGLSCSNAGASTSEGRDIETTCLDGSIVVEAAP